MVLSIVSGKNTFRIFAGSPAQKRGFCPAHGRSAPGGPGPGRLERFLLEHIFDNRSKTDRVTAFFISDPVLFHNRPEGRDRSGQGRGLLRGLPFRTDLG